MDGDGRVGVKRADTLVGFVHGRQNARALPQAATEFKNAFTTEESVFECHRAPGFFPRGLN
ncbi:hypothetical protein GCM10010249_18110 [Streptomyces roseolilacinus]|uniref:Uncharacterized protein n=1 Tax=Streptomyces roseolilacinus TaxID=66904 RepID=A0A918EKL9_9ACTN|nr:hypothetical protein GCM10010249_18110 [Streptomyces roseolilacinus]